MVLDQILSTFKFINKKIAPTISIRNILYKKTVGWVDFNSNTGYSLQYPPSFSNSSDKEEYRDNACYAFFGNNAGGIIMAKVVPYSGGSRRELYGLLEGYEYNFEEVILQGKNSLIIQRGPLGDSGSGSGIVMPVGKYALIVSWDKRAMDSSDFTDLIQSIKIDSVLDTSKCNN